MVSSLPGRFVCSLVLFYLLALSGSGWAHVVPNMVIEADFEPGGSYTLHINLDPRTFLSADPTSLPPVPGTWYREQTEEQIASTQQRAREYLASALSVVFGGQPAELPPCEVQAIDGDDNSPLRADTREMHLLVTAKGRIPSGAVEFQLEFGKDANTSLILMHSQSGKSELRPQVIFPGETSRAFRFENVEAPAPPPAARKTGEITLVVTLAVTCIFGIAGWRLLKYYRHHHRAHRKPPSIDEM